MPCAKRAIKSCSHSVAGRACRVALQLGQDPATGGDKGVAVGGTRRDCRSSVLAPPAVTRYFGQWQNVTDQTCRLFVTQASSWGFLESVPR